MQIDPSFEAGHPVSHIGTLLDSFPKLEVFSSEADVLNLDLSLASSSLTQLLLADVSTDNLPGSFEVTDNITFLEIKGFEEPEVVNFPKFRNLVTFSLTYFEGDADDLLVYVHQNNPKLVNMLLDEIQVSEEVMQQIFPKNAATLFH